MGYLDNLQEQVTLAMDSGIVFKANSNSGNITYMNTTFSGKGEPITASLFELFDKRQKKIEEMRQFKMGTTEYCRCNGDLGMLTYDFFRQICKDKTIQYMLHTADVGCMKIFIHAPSKTVVAVADKNFECDCKTVVTPKETVLMTCYKHSMKIHWSTAGFSLRFLDKFREWMPSWNPTEITENEDFNKLPTSLAGLLYEGKSVRDIMRAELPNLEATKKEYHIAYQIYVKGTPSHWPDGQSLEIACNNMANYIKKYWAEQYGVEDDWAIRHRNRTTYQWVGRHMEQLTKKRVNQHGDELAPLFNRLDEVADEDLVNGAKTSVERVFEIVDQRALEIKLKGYDPKMVFPEPLCPETAEIRYIKTPKELVEEGEFMRHCVGTYLEDAANGNSYIYRIRTEDGASTLEITKDIDDELILEQHRGKRNETPPQEHIDMVNEWCREHGITDTTY